MMSKRSFRARLALGTALAGMALYGYGPRRAYAGACAPGLLVGEYDCNGAATAADTTQTFNANTVGLQDGFGIDTSAAGGNALDITNADGEVLGLAITDDFAAAIIGATNGLVAASYDGSLTISLTGSVTGQTGTGINAYNGLNAVDLDITAATVTGDNTGIFALHEGTGAVSITTTGTVVTTAGAGINVDAGATSTGVTIDAQDAVVGGGDGIVVAHDGAGAVSISGGAGVSGAGGDGVSATNTVGAGATSITIDVTGDVIGTQRGIYAQNFGIGALSITAGGDVSGGLVHGISAANLYGTDLIIDVAGGVASNGVAIAATNSGSGIMSITVGGDLTATGGNGVFAYAVAGSAGVSVAVAGDIDAGQIGVEAVQNGAGDLSITTGGSVAGGTGYGIYGNNSSSGDSLIIDAAGDVTGGTGGILAINGGTDVLSITVGGSVSGDAEEGIWALNYGTDLTIDVAGDVTSDGAADDAILAVNDGTGALSITVGGIIASPGGDGVNAQTGATTTGLSVAVQGEVVARGNGIYAAHGGAGDLSITTGGAVTGTVDDGVYANNAAAGANLTIQTAGPVDGNLIGIRATNNGTGALSITTSGAVSGATDQGILAVNSVGGTDVTIQAGGDVTGVTGGVQANNFGSGLLTITGGGAIDGGTGDGVGVFSGGLTSGVMIDLQGAVSGADEGIYVSEAGAGGVSITTAGDVNGGDDGIFAFNNGGGVLSVTTTSGTVAGAAADGIDLFNGTGATDLTITLDGDVTGATRGVAAQNDGTGDLTITGAGAITGGSDDAVFALNSATAGGIQIDLSGTIDSGQRGIVATNSGTGGTSITTAGDVTSDYIGIDTNDNGGGVSSITIASGTVSGAGAYGVRASNSSGDMDIAVDGAIVGGGRGLSVTNGGGALTITGGGAITGGTGIGVNVLNGLTSTDLTIDLGGTISGGEDGISAYNSGTGNTSITTAGDVSGADFGIAASNLADGALTITTLSGTVTGAGADGIYAYNDVTGTSLTIDAQGAVSGGQDAIQAINNGTGALAITTAGGAAGADNGIFARNYSAQALSITTSGAVSGAGQYGINAVNGLTGTDLTVQVDGAVTGNVGGLAIVNAGSGVTSITGGGAIAATSGSGVYAANGSASGGIAIDLTGGISGGEYGITATNVGSGGLSIATAADVTGQRSGILATNAGAGALTITAAAGTVSGVEAYGIYAVNEATGSSLTIQADADVVGNTRGLAAANDGTGALAITGTGAITSGVSDGLYARNQGSATSMTIDLAGAVSAGSRGVAAFNNGTGQLSITTAGSVTGASADGIWAAHYGDAEMTIATGDVSGATFGVYADNNGIGALSITTAGAVSGGSAHGIYAANSVASTDLRVEAQGEVSGGLAGILVRSDGTGTAQVVVGGSVLGGTGAGIDIESAADGTVIEIGVGGQVGSLSDQAIRVGDTATTITNDGTLTGFFTLGGGADNVTNTASTSLDLRDFADTDGDGIRDTKNIAVASFGGGSDSFTNAAGGTVRLLTVEDQDGFTAATDDDTAPVAFNTSGVAGYTPAGVTAVSIETAGVERAHLIGLETFVNAGAITMQDAMTGGLGPVAGDVLVISASETAGVSGGGVFVSEGGSLHLDTVLNDGTVDTTDVLVVDSTAVGGAPTAIYIANAGGAGGLTDVNRNQQDDDGEGILVVDVLDPGASASGVFTLGEPTVAGVYRYELSQAATGGDWYLVSRFAASLAVYEALPQALFTLNQVGSLRDRIGNRVWAADVSGQEGQGKQAVQRRAGGDVRSELSQPEVRTGMVWGRLDGQIRRGVDSDVTGFGVGYDLDRWRMQLGIDALALERQGGDLVVGLSAQLSEVSLDLTSEIGGGSVDATNYGFATAVTWYGHNGLYADGQLQVGLFQIDLEADEIGRLRSDSDGLGYAFSAEVGHRFALNRGWSLTPQGQLAYGSVDFERFTDEFGATVSMSGADSLTGRLGLAADYERKVADQARQWRVYTIANLSYQALGAARVTVSDLRVAGRDDRWKAEVGVGGVHSWAGGKYALFGQVDVGTSLEDFADNYDLTATAGLRLSF